MTQTASSRLRYFPNVVTLESRQVRSFLPAVGYPAGSGPNEPAVADFNGDGRLDVVVSLNGDDSIAFLRGRGTGTLAPPKLYPTGDAPFGLKAADLNADGKLDIVTANFVGNTVSALLGNGDGSFQPRMDFPAGTDPLNIAVGDLNGDGKLDVAVTNPTGHVLIDGPLACVLMGNGDGTFKRPVRYYVGAAAWSVDVGDLDGDGIDDLSATAGNDSWVKVFLSSGSASTYPAGGGPQGHVQADVDGNGHLDLVVGHATLKAVSVLLNVGNGTFTPKSDYAVAEAPRYLTVADVNQDGRPDVASTPTNGGSVSVLLGLGDGTFGPHTEYQSTSIAKITAGDLNGDGYPDLITGSGIGKVMVLMNDRNWAPPIPGPSGQAAPAQRWLLTHSATNGQTHFRIPPRSTELSDVSQEDAELCLGTTCVIEWTPDAMDLDASLPFPKLRLIL